MTIVWRKPDDSGGSPGRLIWHIGGSDTGTRSNPWFAANPPISHGHCGFHIHETSFTLPQGIPGSDIYAQWIPLRENSADLPSVGTCQPRGGGDNKLHMKNHKAQAMTADPWKTPARRMEVESLKKNRLNHQPYRPGRGSPMTWPIWITTAKPKLLLA